MKGRFIGITAARRAHEQAALVTSLGGVPVLAPTVELDRGADDDALGPRIDQLLSDSPDLLIVMTGIGAGHLVRAADRTQRGTALRSLLANTRVVARGTKARNALRRLNARVDQTAEPPSTAGLIRIIDTMDARGMTAGVICSGPDDDPIVGELRARGITTTTIHPYTIDVAAADEPVLQLADAVHSSALAAITFTSANAVAGYFAVCPDDVHRPPPPEVAVVAVGPVTRRALEQQGWRVDVEPDTPRMGAMFHALARYLCADETDRDDSDPRATP